MYSCTDDFGQPVVSAPAPQNAYILAPAPAPMVYPAPVLQPEDPCERHPDVEKDELAAFATLDEAGYQSAAAGQSPINVKRFVCRVVAKLQCQVTDLPSMMGFVLDYNGSKKHQTYAHLEAVLATLCQAGGKWVVPLAGSQP